MATLEGDDGPQCHEGAKGNSAASSQRDGHHLRRASYQHPAWRATRSELNRGLLAGTPCGSGEGRSGRKGALRAGLVQAGLPLQTQLRTSSESCPRRSSFERTCRNGRKGALWAGLVQAGLSLHTQLRAAPKAARAALPLSGLPATRLVPHAAPAQLVSGVTRGGHPTSETVPRRPAPGPDRATAGCPDAAPQPPHQTTPTTRTTRTTHQRLRRRSPAPPPSHAGSERQTAKAPRRALQSDSRTVPRAATALPPHQTTPTTRTTRTTHQRPRRRSPAPPPSHVGSARQTAKAPRRGPTVRLLNRSLCPRQPHRDSAAQYSPTQDRHAA